jgi:hypothetical protein
MKTIPSKLWSVASGNQTVSGDGGDGILDQNQSIPDFIRGYKGYNPFKIVVCSKIFVSQTMKNLKKCFICVDLATADPHPGQMSLP